MPHNVYLPLLNNPYALIEPIIPSGDPVILFGSDRAGDGTHDLYSMNIDGSNIVRLTHLSIPPPPNTHSVNSLLGASWSPDRSQIALHVDSTIYLMDADGSNRQTIYSHPIIKPTAAPEWSPDGQHFAFIVYSTEDAPSGARESGIMIYNVQTQHMNKHLKDNNVGNPIILRNIPVPRWLPDGQKLITNSTVNGKAYMLSGNGFYEETPFPQGGCAYDVSRYGDKVFYISSYSLGYLEISNTSKTILYDSNGTDWLLKCSVAIHPNQDKLAVTVSSILNGVDETTYLFDTKTNTYEDMTPFDHFSRVILGWTPNGDYLVYSSSKDRYKSVADYTYGIYVLPFNGTSATSLSPNLAYHEYALDVR